MDFRAQNSRRLTSKWPSGPILFTVTIAAPAGVVDRHHMARILECWAARDQGAANPSIQFGKEDVQYLSSLQRPSKQGG